MWEVKTYAPDPEPPLLLSIPQAAYLLGISQRTVKTLIARKELPVRRIGRRTLVARAALEVYAGMES